MTANDPYTRLYVREDALQRVIDKFNALQADYAALQQRLIERTESQLRTGVRDVRHVAAPAVVHPIALALCCPKCGAQCAAKYPVTVESFHTLYSNPDFCVIRTVRATPNMAIVYCTCGDCGCSDS